ncbi:hypothetical protein CR513_52323, partial [Mucuna pruriens]
MEEEKVRAYFRDSLEAYLTREISLDLGYKVEKYVNLIQIAPFLKPRQATIEKLELRMNKWDEKTTPKVELKPLPSTLRYKFLGPNSSNPVIVNGSLSEMKVIRYYVEDIKGINPSFCVHGILMEEGHKSYVNLNMKEEVKNENLKLLDAKVSRIHMIPKNDEMSIMKNEKNEFVLIRTMTG